ncbi:MAG: ImmA/IrrE family metallo-endopeptidase [Clostridia bacterium]|nr:ImmA/IrrE family metallo-endopeptidase [Clostridia bacterium]
MKCLSRQDIEAIATRVVTAYYRLPELQGQPIHRIDPELLLTKVLGLSIEYCHLSRDNSILGATSASEMGIEVYDNDDNEAIYFLDGKTVLVEKDLKKDAAQQGRCNFTIAHEGSHQILKMLYPREYGANFKAAKLHFYCPNSEKKKPISDWEEWQANALGSAILLPKDKVEQAMFMFGLGNKITMLNRIVDLPVYKRFKDLACFLGVSKSALAIRLKQLGMLENDYLDDPYRILDIQYDGGGRV